MTDLLALLQEARRLLDGNHGRIGVGDRIAICSAIDAALAEKAPEPFCYVLTLNGVLCDGDNVVSTDADQLQVDSMQDYAADGEKYEATPLYAAPPTASPDDARVRLTDDQITQLAKESSLLPSLPDERPTIEELERILQQPDGTYEVKLRPDGSITAYPTDAVLTFARAIEAAIEREGGA